MDLSVDISMDIHIHGKPAIFFKFAVAKNCRKFFFGGKTMVQKCKNGS